MASKFDEWLEIGTKIGLRDRALTEFVSTQIQAERDEKAAERAERAAEREAKTAQREIQRQEYEVEQRIRIDAGLERERLAMEERQHQREYELEKLKLEAENSPADRSHISNGVKTKAPRLPLLKKEDNVDAYLKRFERYAELQEWHEAEWAINLSNLLTGKALDVYYRLSDNDAGNYQKLRSALLHRFEYTVEGFQTKFRNTTVEEGETPTEYIARLKSYLDKWIELAKVNKNYDGLSIVMVREQFLSVCDKDLSVYLNREADMTHDSLADMAERYLASGHRTFKVHTKTSSPSQGAKPKNGKGNEAKCFKCGKAGHKQNDCRGGNKVDSKVNDKENVDKHVKPRGRCFICDKIGHKAVDCRSRQTAAAVIQSDVPGESKPNMACLCLGNVCISDVGRELPTVLGVEHKDHVVQENRMPVARGYVGDVCVTMLRDTGCSGVVVKKNLVHNEQFTGDVKPCRLIDGTVIHVPMAQIHVDTPYYVGVVEAMCMTSPVYDLVVGNVTGARAVGDVNTEWKLKHDDTVVKDHEVVAVVTRSQKQRKVVKPLLVTESEGLNVPVTVDVMKQMQKEDVRISKLQVNQKRQSKNTVTWYEKNNDMLYKFSKCVKTGRVQKQLVVPRGLIMNVMSVAHESPLAGHMGIRKTNSRVRSCFTWPGMDADICRFCRSCDICQRTISKGRVTKVPLGNMPIIEQPFERVGVDLIGPIHPKSERGHRYILTMVDYATRYPEAIPLRGITTEEVAEAMLTVFTRMGVPKEILSDLGTQFTSQLMHEVSRLLSVKKLFTTPYNPRCNGLTEKINGVLKSMLKKLTAERPTDWDRYIDPVLFAYREVPQDSTGFSPFELIFGRTVRGPMQILKEAWTVSGDDQTETLTSYEYVLDLKERLSETCELARQELAKSQAKYKRYYNKKARDRSYNVDDFVLLLLPTDNNKLLLQWKGPFKIVQKMSPCDYKIDINGKVKNFHVNMLKQYHVRKDSNVFETANSAILIDNDELNDTDDDLCFEYGSGNSLNDVNVGPLLNRNQTNELHALMCSYQSIFSEKPGRTDLISHQIELTTDTPVRTKCYPVPYMMRAEIQKELDTMLDMDIIEESDSPFAAPIVIVKKKDGTNRFCIDYRKLNKVTLFDPEPMTKPDDIYAKVQGSKFLSKIDICKGYWQIPVRQEDQVKTAFVTPESGAFQFKRMPFGLMNSGATFNRMMRKLLKNLNNVCSYIDDILIFTNTWQDHLNVMKELFKRLSKHNLTVKASKCMFAFDKLDYVGHNISGSQISVIDDNVEKVVNAPRPVTKKNVKSFIGLTSYYRNLIPNFADIAYPLTELTKKGKPHIVQWETKHEHAFNTLKSKLVDKPILQMPDWNKQFVVQVDASDKGLGAALLQWYDNQLLPVAYASRKLLPREQNYATIEKECLAIVYAVKKFREYLFGVSFVLQTDHQPLVFINHNRFNNDRIMRWSLLLQPYHMLIESIAGKDNVVADYLSRSGAE